MEDELNRYLDDLNRDASYRVEAVLKRRDVETTEVVWLVGETGAETGPFIRKTIALRPGLGQAYGRLFDAQQRGRRFLYLPRVLDCHETADSLVVVMEYVRGVTLSQLVESQGASVGFARGVFPFVCDAVSELHERFDPPLIHRDLKPGNVMVSEGDFTLIDLGIARDYDESAAADTCCFGTRGYAPPEQFGFGQTDERSDVYALGLLLFFCLTGRDAAAADREARYVHPGVPEPLRRVVAKAASFDPDDRYGSVRELRSAFLAALGELQAAHPAAGAPVAAPPQGSPWPAAAPAPAPRSAPAAAADPAPRSAAAVPAAARRTASAPGGRGAPASAKPSARAVPSAATSAPAPAAPAGSANPAPAPSAPAPVRPVVRSFWAGKSTLSGILVDVMLALFAGVLLWMGVDLSLDPDPGSVQFAHPLPVRFAEFFSIVLFILIPPLYLAADKRPLQKLSPRFRPLSAKEAWLVVAVG